MLPVLQELEAVLGALEVSLLARLRAVLEAEAQE
jgi:hypothetical protein